VLPSIRAVSSFDLRAQRTENPNHAIGKVRTAVHKGRLEFKALADEHAVLGFENAEPPGELADLFSSLSRQFRLELSQARLLCLMGKEAGSAIGHFTDSSGQKDLYII
jgi:hypothetical protein